MWHEMHFLCIINNYECSFSSAISINVLQRNVLQRKLLNFIINIVWEQLHLYVNVDYCLLDGYYIYYFTDVEVKIKRNARK